jgi:poly(A) polymerase
LNDSPATTALHGAPRIIPRSDHPVSRSAISPNALRVLYRLKDAGYQGFLVGGCVRDIILGRHPKDFDVATDALPEEVRRLFRNCRLVGRRFRLAHVVYGQEVIEVATFRAASAPPPSEEPMPGREEDEEGLLAVEADEEGSQGSEDDDGDDDGDGDSDDGDADDEDAGANDARDPGRGAAAHNPHRHQDDRGRLLRDNIYGSIDEDVWRRDFTVNALYYNIADFSIWDYAGGLEDIHARRLRLIGDVETRYREDPVRMLRAARFEAKLGFRLDGPSSEPIPRLRGLLAGVPPARLFDETTKLFLSGDAEASLRVLRERGLLGELFPSVARYLEQHPDGAVSQLLEQGLHDTDARVAADRPVTPTYLLALLLYGPIAARIEAMPPERWTEPSAILEACDAALRDACQRVAIPKRFTLGVRELIALQPRLENPRGRRALRLLEQPRFRAAYDLLLLRARQGLASPAVAEWWEKLQAAAPEQREQIGDTLQSQDADEPGGAPRRRRRRRPRRRG